MNDTWVTLQGWAGGEVSERDANGVPVASFRMACTPSWTKNGEWVDGPTSWFTVTAWRTLARNVAASVHKGDPVVVHGRMRAEVWERESGASTTTHVVDATFVGHDLNRGTSSFVRPARRDDAGAAAAAGSASASSAA